MEKSIFLFYSYIMNGYFFDMDGTLYNNAFHEVSDKTFEMLNYLQKRGDFVGLATSRCRSELKNLPFAMRSFHFDCLISDGGSFISQNEREYVDSICVEDMKKIDAFSKRNHLSYRYSTKDGNYLGTDDSQYAHDIYFRLYLNAPIQKEYCEDEALNVILFCEDKLKEQAKVLFKHLSIVEYPDCLEIRACGVDKACAIEKMMREHDFEKVYCFGDGENDVDMLKLADVSCAMENGCDALKNVADYVIGRVDEDGIYKFLKEEEGE